MVSGGGVQLFHRLEGREKEMREGGKGGKRRDRSQETRLCRRVRGGGEREGNEIWNPVKTIVIY